MMNQFLGMGETGCINSLGPRLQSTLNWGSETNRNLFSYSSGGHKSAVRVLTGPCSVRSLWGGSFLASSSFWWPQVSLGLWQHHCSLCLCGHMAFCVFLSSLLIRTPLILG